jgi:dihydropteroate synthase
VLKRKKYQLKLRSQTLVLGAHTLVMGVLNVTPDSFSDGGEFLSARAAVKQALAMQAAGAHLIDIGAESTRPSSRETPAEEELRRLLPVLEALRGELSIPISVDTRKAAVAEAALQAGAEMINDVSGLRHDAGLARVAARYQAPLLLMHMRGEPHSMQRAPFARNVVANVLQGLRWSVATARKNGVAKSRILLDPGIGFGKSWPQNYELLARLGEIAKLGFPIVIGTSRKGFLGAPLTRQGKSAPVGRRIWGTAATVTASILNGAHIVRVHDVAEMAQVARVADCVLRPDLAPRN